MSIQEKWMVYCGFEPEYATQDDWFHFVNDVYTSWLNDNLKNDPNYDPEHFLDCHQYLENTYGFDVFMDSTPEFEEIRKLEPVKFQMITRRSIPD